MIWLQKYAWTFLKAWSYLFLVNSTLTSHSNPSSTSRDMCSYNCGMALASRESVNTMIPLKKYLYYVNWHSIGFEFTLWKCQHKSLWSIYNFRTSYRVCKYNMILKYVWFCYCCIISNKSVLSYAKSYNGYKKDGRYIIFCIKYYNCFIFQNINLMSYS